MGLVTVLYVFVKVSLFLPQLVEVRAFSILIVFSALSFEVLICSLNVSLGSKVSPSILGLRIGYRSLHCYGHVLRMALDIEVEGQGFVVDVGLNETIDQLAMAVFIGMVMS